MRNTTEMVLRSLPGVYMCVDRCCQCNSITTMQDAVMQLHKCLVEIKLMAELEEGSGQSKCVCGGGSLDTPLLHLWLTVMFGCRLL